ncbi:TIGR01244 family sulfur transferase [Diaphorobacter sp.]|uniref:TIGR01244 family sulfur transferase n=1 Tax=Diaphorobacter sp. TaxID=1934310 RepID=UPI0028A8BFEA|nr:TIGR01244 family sulfur transferase [Diaphorobacter sp.]
MDFKIINKELAVSPQITAADLHAIAQAGYRSVVCNRPDGEAGDQPGYLEIEHAAQALGLQARYLPVTSGKVTDDEALHFGDLMTQLPGPVLAYCRTGTRSATLWALSQALRQQPVARILESARNAGYDLSGVARRIANGGRTPTDVVDAAHEIVIVGAGAAGIAVAASLLVRKPGIDIALIDPADVHYYQPGWTMVGAGVFPPAHTARTMASVLPPGVKWLKAAVAAFEPERNVVVLDGCRVVKYEQLIVCPGLKLDWDGIEGLPETLGRNGVTSNYRYDLAPYTWELVQALRGGRAVFTQPPMPIKCAGAPQKAMYLSADHWKRQGVLNQIDIQFCNAGGVLFGVADYVPALMEYVNAYGIHLQFNHQLVAVNGPAHEATFVRIAADGTKDQVTLPFDMLHVVPPQKAPDFIRVSPLADAAGWVDVDPSSLRHKKYANIFALGDCTNTTNAKTAAAARKQAPVVAHNVLAARGVATTVASYDGYGSCPLTVERGKIVLAEFTYGGKLAPSFPKWLIDGTRPSALAWQLKERILPPVYWDGMLKGREWLAHPAMAERVAA